MITTNTMLLQPVTVAGPTAHITPEIQQGSTRSFQVFGVSNTGTGVATLQIQATNDGSYGWIDLLDTDATLNFGVSASSDGFVVPASYAHFRLDIKSISGDGAKVGMVVGG